MATRLLELKRVSKAFGGLQVISDLDFHVDEHEIVSVIGPNGAGKTTLFNLVTGVYEPDHGEILFEGESIVGLPPNRITRKGIARTFQTLRLFLNMTVKENVMAATYGHTHAGDRVDAAHSRDAPRGARDQPAGRGEARVLRPAADGLPLGPARLQPLVREPAAARDRARDGDRTPRILLLDEPAAGMNPVETHEITELIGKLRDDGGYTILVIEHDMHVVEGISDRVVALDHGVKIAEGSFDEVATNPTRGRGVPRPAQGGTK